MMTDDRHVRVAVKIEFSKYGVDFCGSSCRFRNDEWNGEGPVCDLFGRALRKQMDDGGKHELLKRCDECLRSVV